MAKGTKESERRSTPWRDNIEAMTVAIIMAVVLKYFIVEAYKIPTGSMQPTLMGQPFDQNRDGIADGGVFDRILVDKLSYHFRDPERFEVVVFKYPLDRSKNFVKRLWGLPGEQLRIDRGDIWVRRGDDEEWSIARRSRKVQLETWKAMDLGIAANVPLWRPDDGGAKGWTLDGRSVRATTGGKVRYVGHGGGTGSIVDTYLHGYPPKIREKINKFPPEPNPVGDLRLTGKVRAEADCARVVVELDDGPYRHRFELPGPAAPADAAPRLSYGPVIHGSGDSSGENAGEPWRLSPDRNTRFAAQNIDDMLTLEVDGEVVCELEVPSVETQRSALRIGVEEGGATFEELHTYRDIYYKSGPGDSEWTIPDEHYFMLGDNTQDSSDSRYWAWYVLTWDGEGSEGQPVRGNRRQAPPGVSAPHDQNPVRHATFGESLTWFRDEWGELYVFPTADESPRLGPTGQPAPFVHRNLIGGRALLVFWPLKPWQGITRLKWIH
jgi:signal peptidase I